MLGNKTLLAGLMFALLASNQVTAMETHPFPRIGYGPNDWHRPTKRGKGERKRMKGARWALPTRTLHRPEEHKRDRAHQGSD